MGGSLVSSFCGGVKLDVSDCQAGPSRAWLQVPRRGSPGGKSLPKASRAYAVGECLELAYCVMLSPWSLQGTYVEPYLYPLPDGSGRRLLASGWGLLYGRCTERNANVAAEIYHERVKADDSTNADINGSSNLGSSDIRYWINFRARQPIFAGDYLFVASSQNLKPIFDCVETFVDTYPANVETDTTCGPDAEDEDAFDMTLYDTLMTQHANGPSPDNIKLLEYDAAPVRLGVSPVHGLGCFAARDISRGEVIELTPLVPMEIRQEFDTGLLDDYLFECSKQLEMWACGYGGIYNHSDHPNAYHVKFKDTPYLEVWIAEVNIKEGEEICHDYGVSYFDTRHMERV